MRSKVTLVKTYFICFKERLLDMEIPFKRHNNFTMEERDALYSMIDDYTSILKIPDKGFVNVCMG